MLTSNDGSRFLEYTLLKRDGSPTIQFGHRRRFLQFSKQTGTWPRPRASLERGRKSKTKRRSDENSGIASALSRAGRRSVTYDARLGLDNPGIHRAPGFVYVTSSWIRDWEKKGRGKRRASEVSIWVKDKTTFSGTLSKLSQNYTAGKAQNSEIWVHMKKKRSVSQKAKNKISVHAIKRMHWGQTLRALSAKHLEGETSHMVFKMFITTLRVTCFSLISDI
ncbi:hypothetical protein ElyMa_005547500 [Elysia marginata]|uniref:Uncharacterized protein n=1 Tax=Elysia marginata TaxID=1093978 RepID=A0AAV4F0R8_9GAST|nr:hypothetical protein ElyMa_005547500 [Elysia marginata]